MCFSFWLIYSNRLLTATHVVKCCEEEFFKDSCEHIIYTNVASATAIQRFARTRCISQVRLFARYRCARWRITRRGSAKQLL